MPSLDDLQVAGHVVIVRVDFNVPLADDGAGGRVIADTGRIEAALPTIEYLRDHGARILLLAHLGRPKGVVTPEASLAPVAQELSRLLSIDVPIAADAAQDETPEGTRALSSKTKNSSGPVRTMSTPTMCV